MASVPRSDVHWRHGDSCSNLIRCSTLGSSPSMPRSSGAPAACFSTWLVDVLISPGTILPLQLHLQQVRWLFLLLSPCSTEHLSFCLGLETSAQSCPSCSDKLHGGWAQVWGTLAQPSPFLAQNWVGARGTHRRRWGCLEMPPFRFFEVCT